MNFVCCILCAVVAGKTIIGTLTKYTTLAYLDALMQDYCVARTSNEAYVMLSCH